MAFIIDRADAVASLLEKFRTADAYQVAGQYANLDFWLAETRHALAALADYEARFEKLCLAQQSWIDAHEVVVGTYCPMCGGQCEFDPDLKSPRSPTKIPSGERAKAGRKLKDAFYFFLIRCYRLHLVEEPVVRDLCKEVGTSIAATDFDRG